MPTSSSRSAEGFSGAAASSADGQADSGGSRLPARQRDDRKVVTCVMLAFGGRPEMEAAFQWEHAAARARYDALRHPLRLVAWLGFTAKAAAWTSGRCLVAMTATACAYALTPLVLMLGYPQTFLRWRCYLVAAWNLAHNVLYCAFYHQLYQLPPAGSHAGASYGPASGGTGSTGSDSGGGEGGTGLIATARSLLWLLWHSQAVQMGLNGGYPLVNTFRFFLQGQLLILMLLLRTNAGHCAEHPKLRASVGVVHTRIVRPAMRALLSPAAPGTADGAADSLQLCSAYLPALQVALGLLLPAVLVYRHERSERQRFLAQRGMRAERLLLRRELGTAMLAVALQLAALLTAESAAASRST